MNYVVLMESIVKIIFIIAIVVLPVLIVWLNNRKKINEANQRTQVVLSAIEKNKETDVEDLLKHLAPQKVLSRKALLKEKLLTKLLLACIAMFIGLSFLLMSILGYFNGGDYIMSIFCGLVLMGIGVSFLINYFVGRKVLANGIDAEQNQLLNQA